MSELAFNINGQPFDVPEAATGWRGRRMKQKGAPEVVCGLGGVHLVLPVLDLLSALSRPALISTPRDIVHGDCVWPLPALDGRSAVSWRSA